MANHNTGHPIGDLIIMIGLTLISWTFAVLDHFFLAIMPNFEMIDVILGYCVKLLALVASAITIRVGIVKLKESKNQKKDAEGK